MNKKNNSAAAANKSQKNETVEVLYQKMGNRWFAFSMVEDEVFVGSITQDEIDEIDAAKAAKAGKNQKIYKITGNS